MTSQTMTVLFADLVGSTSLYQKAGDVEAHQLVTDSLQCMETVIERCGGELLKKVGDAVLASFENADSAYLAAVGIQQEHVSLDLSVRVGFHHGEVILDTGDIYGNAVNLAARVASFAQGDEICTTENTVAQLSVKYRASAYHLDFVNFKGVSEPMAVYRVQWNSDNSETTIMAGVGHTQRNESNLVLDLLSGGKRIRVDEKNPSITLGRSIESDVIVDSESASRNHARIERVRGRYVLQDSSTNGTYLLTSSFTHEFILRESVTLDNVGTIGLGFIPDSGSPNVIEFKVTTLT